MKSKKKTKKTNQVALKSKFLLLDYFFMFNFFPR